MDPILIGTAVSEHVIKEMSKPAVPLVKALWRTIILSIFMITSWLIIIHTLRVHYAHAAANLNSGYSKYAKVARVHYFCTIALRNISRSADASVSVAFGWFTRA